MAQKTLSAPMAVIKIGGVTVGKMRNVRITETIRRGKVTGLGELNPSERPALEWDGSFSAGQYAFKLTTGILGLIDRNCATVEDFKNKVLFNEGVDVCLLMKTKTTSGTNVTYDLTTIATVKGVMLNQEGLEISEGGIGGRDCSGDYMEPILYSPSELTV